MYPNHLTKAVTSLFGPGLAKDFTEYGRPASFSRITHRLRQKKLQSEMIAFNEKMFCGEPRHYTPDISRRIDLDLFVRIKVQSVLRGFYAINIAPIEGLFESISYSLFHNEYGNKIVRAGLIIFIYKNREKLLKFYGETRFNELTESILQPQGKYFVPPEDLLEIISEFLQCPVMIYQTDSQESVYLRHYIPSTSKTLVKICIMQIYDNNGLSRFSPLLFQQDHSVQTEKANGENTAQNKFPNLVYKVNSTMADEQNADITRPTIPFWRTRITSDQYMLHLQENDNIYHAAASFFSHNPDKSHCVLNTHWTSHRFRGNDISEFNFLRSEWREFAPIDTKFTYLSEGVYFVYDTKEKLCRTNNAIDNNKQLEEFSNIKSPLICTDAVTRILESTGQSKDGVHFKIYRPDATTNFDLSKHDRTKTDKKIIGKQQFIGHQCSQFREGIEFTETNTSYIVGTQGSALPIAFPPYYSSYVILNSGPFPVEFRILERSVSFHLLDNFKIVDPPPTQQKDKPLKNQTKNCFLACSKKYFLTDKYQDVPKTQIVTLHPNQILITASGAMMQAVFTGFSFLSIGHAIFPDYRRLVSFESSFHDCPRKAFKKQIIGQLIQNVQVQNIKKEIEPLHDENLNIVNDGATEIIVRNGRRNVAVKSTSREQRKDKIQPDTLMSKQTPAKNKSHSLPSSPEHKRQKHNPPARRTIKRHTYARVDSENEPIASRLRINPRQTQRLTIEELSTPLIKESTSREERTCKETSRSSISKANKPDRPTSVSSQEPDYPSDPFQNYEAGDFVDDENDIDDENGKEEENVESKDAELEDDESEDDESEDDESEGDENGDNVNGDNENGEDDTDNEHYTPSEEEESYSEQEDIHSKKSKKKSNHSGKFICGKKKYKDFVPPEGCCGCKMRFVQSQHLRRHIKSKMPNHEVYGCPYCKKEFNQNADLSQHIVLNHGKKKLHICPYCDSDYGHRSHLIVHMDIHHHNLPKPPKKKRNAIKKEAMKIKKHKPGPYK